MKYIIALFLLFAAPLQAAQETSLIYALSVYETKELVEEECRTVLTVAEKVYIAICNDGYGESHETVCRFDKHWRNIKRANAE